MSLRHRLVAGFLAIAAVLVLTNVALARRFTTSLTDRVDAQLIRVGQRPVFRSAGPVGRGSVKVNADTLSEYYIAHADLVTGHFREFPSAIRDGRPLPALTVDVLNRYRSPFGTPPQPFTVDAESGPDQWRLVAVTDRAGTVTVIGASLREIEQTIDRLRRVQLAGTAAVVLALGIVSWWMLRLGVHPIEDMAATADAIAAGDLSRRVDHPGIETEAGRLGTALNAMLERIEEAFRAREASEDRVRRFAADASHELRTPLTSIRGYAELWRAGGLRDGAALGDAMARIEAEASRMGTLVEDLLLLARLDQRRPLERAAVRLDEVARDAVNDARAVEPDRPIDLVVEPVVVPGDEMRFRQVVGNLLANVRVHTPVDAPVRVAVSSSGSAARLVVADRGPGMAPEVRDAVFERFFRADPSRVRSGGGAGLGLSIVAAIVDAHGGEVSVASAPGEGSTFTVTLPLRPAQPSEAPARSPFARPEPSSTP